MKKPPRQTPGRFRWRVRNYAVVTGMPFSDSIFAEHSFGPVWCT
jgi:hypothetical protein